MRGKPAIAYDCIYPLYSIDNPALMTKLSPDQTRYVSIDAVNHVVEAATSIVANPVSIAFGIETIRLVAKYLPKALRNPEDLKARYALLYASMIAGTGFDNGLLHYTHAMEHPLSGMKPELTHGLGLAILLPAVVLECYPASVTVPLGTSQHISAAAAERTVKTIGSFPRRDIRAKPAIKTPITVIKMPLYQHFMGVPSGLGSAQTGNRMNGVRARAAPRAA